MGGTRVFPDPGECEDVLRMLFWHGLVARTLRWPVGTSAVMMNLANGGLSIKVKGSMNGRIQQKSQLRQSQVVAAGCLSRRPADHVPCGFREHCWVSSMPRAKVTDPTQGLCRLLAKAGRKPLSIVPVGADDSFSWRPFWFYLSFSIYRTKCLYWSARAWYGVI